MTHTYDCRVRWSDVDAYGHVNNVKYFEYYQEARIAFLATCGQTLLRAEGTEQYVVARLTVDYRRAIVFRAEPFPIDSWISRVGTSSYDVESHIRDGDEVLSRATAVMVAYDLRTRRPRPLGEAERSALHRVLDG
jgi:acyl-CoA thioester hydrolase